MNQTEYDIKSLEIRLEWRKLEIRKHELEIEQLEEELHRLKVE